MSNFRVSLDDSYSFVVEGFSTVNFVRGDCLKIDDRSKTVTKDKPGTSLVGIEESQGGFITFLLTGNSPVSGLIREVMEKQKRDMTTEKDHSFSVIIMSKGIKEFHLKKCLFNLQISDVKKHYFFIMFKEQDVLLKTLNESSVQAIGVEYL